MFPSLSASNQSAASADSSNSGDVGDVRNALEVSPAGNRGFQNNFAAAGASLNADQGINASRGLGSSGSGWLWAVGAAVAVGGLYYLKRRT